MCLEWSGRLHQIPFPGAHSPIWFTLLSLESPCAATNEGHVPRVCAMQQEKQVNAKRSPCTAAHNRPYSQNRPCFLAWSKNPRFSTARGPAGHQNRVTVKRNPNPTTAQVRVELLGSLHWPRARAWSLGVLSGGGSISLQHREAALEELQKQSLGTDALFPGATERQRPSESKRASCFSLTVPQLSTKDSPH